MRCYCLWGEDYFIEEFLQETSKALTHISNTCSKEFCETILGSRNQNIQDDYININDLDKYFETHTEKLYL